MQQCLLQHWFASQDAVDFEGATSLKPMNQPCQRLKQWLLMERNCSSYRFQRNTIRLPPGGWLHSCLGMGRPGFSDNPEQEKSLDQLIDKRGTSEIGLPCTAGYVFAAYGPRTCHFSGCIAGYPRYVTLTAAHCRQWTSLELTFDFSGNALETRVDDMAPYRTSW